MKILAIDGATSRCSVCVCEIEQWQDIRKIFAEKTYTSSKGLAEQLVPMIECVLKDSQLSYDSLDIIGVTNGPGAFTGMRIAIAGAKAIAMAANKPVIGVSSITAILDSFLHRTHPQKLLPMKYCAVILETKRKDYYFQMFEVKGNAGCVSINGLCQTIPARVASALEITSIIGEKDAFLVGNAVNRFKIEAKINYPYFEILFPKCEIIAKLAAKYYLEDNISWDCKPVYLRGAEISQPKKKHRDIKS